MSRRRGMRRPAVGPDRVTATVGFFFALLLAFVGGWVVSGIVSAGWLLLSVVVVGVTVSVGWGVWRGWQIAKHERAAELRAEIDAATERMQAERGAPGA